MTLNLSANNTEQNLIKEFLQNNVNEFLANKINNGVKIQKDGKTLTNKKTLNGFMDYACEEAKKLATKGAKFACLHHDTVFGWAMHYFEEDDILGTLYNEDGTEYKPIVKKVSTPATTTITTYTPPVKKPEPQMSLFDMFSTKKEETTPPIIEDDEPTPEDIQDAFAELEKEEHVEQVERPTNPIYAKYLELQNQYPYSIIAYRLGDFYEVFGDGATKISNPLDLTLTGRDFGLKERVPMVGFPCHCADKYFEKIATISKLVIYEDNKITIYTCDKKPCTINMETGEVSNSETSNPVIDNLLKIFGDQMEILLWS